MKKLVKLVFALMFSFIGLTGIAHSAPGALLATVTLPSNGDCNVAGTFDGTYYIAINSIFCSGSTIGIYSPPAASGAATAVSTKNIVDSGDNPVDLSALAWDPTRDQLWGAHNGNMYLIDIGDPTASGNALAVFQFNITIGSEGFAIVDGLAYDDNDDTLWVSPDIDTSVYHYQTDGTYLGAVIPEDASGNPDGDVSGVVVGSGNTLYIGRNGNNEIRLINKTSGDFISTFATTAGRVEDLTCDPYTYAPLEAVLAKDAYEGLYEAFEVELGTCPIPLKKVAFDIKPGSCPNPMNVKSKGVLPAAIMGTENFDVTTIDPSTLELGGVAPLGWAIADVGEPFEPFTGKTDCYADCVDCSCADGNMDLVFHFDTQEVVAALGEVDDGACLTVKITGELDSGIPFEGEDVIIILKKGR